MQFKSFMEALKGKQHKIDKNKNGQIDAHDFKLLRKEETDETIEESEERMARADYKTSPSGRKSHKEIVFNSGEENENEKKDKIEEKAPPGFEGTVKAMKKHKEIDNPYALAWYMKNKGMKSHKKESGAMKEESELDEKISTAQMGHAGKTTIKHIKNPTVTQRMAAHDVKPGVAGYRDRIDLLKAAKAQGNLKEDAEQLDEVNHREFASQGKMHPDMAKHMKVGNEMDFYAHGTGDKITGTVTKNDGKAVHVKAGKSTHKFAVSKNLGGQMQEEKKEDPPFDGPYTKTKPTKNSDGTPQAPMSRAKHLARMAMKKAMKEEFDIDMSDEQADSVLHSIDEASPHLVAPVPGMKWKDHAVMVHPKTKQRVVVQRSNAKNYPESEGWKEVAPGMKLKEDDQVKFSYAEVMMINEIKLADLPVRKVTGHSYGADYSDPEGADDYDDNKKPMKPAAEKRGRGRPAGSKSGARKNIGTSKLYK